MKIIVVEDNIDFNKYICDRINKFLFENDYDYPLVTFFDFDKNLEKTIHDNEIKIYIVDLELKSRTGYDVCRKIREEAGDWNSIIIISSVHNEKENIISLRLSVFTYLSKLYDFEENLLLSIKQAIKIIENNNIISINRNLKIHINDICYVLKESNSKYCIIKTIDCEEYRIRTSLKSLENKFKFTRIKDYILINEYNILKIDSSSGVLFKNKTEIKL